MSPALPSRRGRAVALAVSALVALGGCVTPFGSDDPTTTPTPTTAPSPVDPAVERAGAQRTEDELTALLPDIPKGSRPEPTDNIPKDRETDPQECVDVLRIGPESLRLKQDEVATAGISWYDPQSRISRGVRITSHSRPIGPELLDRAGNALGGCDAFSLTGTDDSGDFDLRVLAEPRTVTLLGEQTFAVRLTTFEQGEGSASGRVYLDHLSFRVGNNIVTITQVIRDPEMSTEAIETLAEDVLEDLRAPEG